MRFGIEARGDLRHPHNEISALALRRAGQTKPVHFTCNAVPLHEAGWFRHRCKANTKVGVTDTGPSLFPGQRRRHLFCQQQALAERVMEKPTDGGGLSAATAHAPKLWSGSFKPGGQASPRSRFLLTLCVSFAWKVAHRSTSAKCLVGRGAVGAAPDDGEHAQLPPLPDTGRSRCHAALVPVWTFQAYKKAMRACLAPGPLSTPRAGTAPFARSRRHHLAHVKAIAFGAAALCCLLVWLEYSFSVFSFREACELPCYGLPRSSAGYLPPYHAPRMHRLLCSTRRRWIQCPLPSP